MVQEKGISQLIDELVSKSLAQIKKDKFNPGISPVPVSGKSIDKKDLVSLISSSLEGWFTSGIHTSEFEKGLAKYIGVRSATFVNSGSSANLLALTALTSQKLGEKRLKPGDEVITVAMGFPTTINPIIQNGLVPVFVDIKLGTYDAIEDQVMSAIGPKTKAIMMAHTLGNPFNVAFIQQICEEHGLWLIEDNCDALGSIYDGKKTGSFGDTSTISFYPAHHITTGEGGAVLTNSPLLKKQIESFRDWGRDCYCETGQDNTCQKRFGWKLGELPEGYDHKYIYSNIGYNLKATDMQAALGNSQLTKINEFVTIRRSNFDLLYEGLSKYEQFILPSPTAKSIPSWFGFPITIKPGSSFARSDLINFLTSRNIGTRLMFAGNILRQPGYSRIAHRKIGNLQNSDLVMENSFWLGVHPSLDSEMIQFVIDSISKFVETNSK